jgi:hypothetical protein
MYSATLPTAFLLAKTVLSVPELHWAFDSGFIDAQAVVDVAVSMVLDADASPAVIALAGVLRSELAEVRGILATVTLEEEEAEAARQKWVWLTLSWLYEYNRDDEDLSDDLGLVYADLGLRGEVWSFGPYSGGTREEAIREWAKYLAQREAAWGRPRP